MYHTHNVCFHCAWRVTFGFRFRFRNVLLTGMLHQLHIIHVLKPYHSPLTQSLVVIALTLWPFIIYFQSFILVWAVLLILMGNGSALLFFHRHYLWQWFILNGCVCTSPFLFSLSLTAVASAVCVCTPRRRYWSLPVMTTPGRCGHCQGTDTLTTGLVPDSSPTWCTTTNAGEEPRNKAICNLTNCPIMLAGLVQ